MLKIREIQKTGLSLIRKLRVLFIGGKDVGCGCLRCLIENSKIDVVGIIANPSDTAKNRWYESAVGVGLENNIPTHTIKDINSSKSISLIKSLSPDIIFAVYYDQILSSEVIDIPPYGCINLHLALSEEYRGCYPTTWAILNGEKRVGATIHYIDTGIDTGDIIAQKEVLISDTDTGKTLYDKCTQAGIELFREQISSATFPNFDRRKQATTSKTKYYKRSFPTQEIDFSKSGNEVFDHIRAHLFEPFPPPYFYIGDTKYIVMKEHD